MQAGRLDRFITLQRYSAVMLPSGDRLLEWATLGPSRRPASVRPASGTEGFTTPQTVAIELTEFRIRYSADVSSATPIDRIIYPALTSAEINASPVADVSAARVYDVVAVHEIGRREGLQIIGSRRPDTVSQSVIITASGVAGGAGG